MENIYINLGFLCLVARVMNAYTECGKKVDQKSFSPFSQQPFEILTWVFTALLTKTNYI